ncbi:acyltransferase [uncultured Winogradskyella sp.]|uniref:acyltransferase family protein n=1 Tax=uncultured Winogradskyella sp. TaxID=395353 RepID=UPI00260B24CB|nr:acyltransferase [uncultured Winogradskyella sp.]
MKNKKTNKSRNVNLDLLRFLGVLIIMVAHAKPPSVFFQLRNFGTPLLIVASSLTYAFIYKNKSIELIPFYKKRITKLTLPAWIFLIVFFLLFYVVTFIFNQDYPFNINTVISTFLFYEGIGFVWILKIYLMLALLTPFGLRFSNSKIRNRAYFSIIFLFYVLYELGNYFVSDYIPVESLHLIENTILLVFPYTALYLYGLRLNNMKTHHVIYVTIFSLLIFIIMAIKKYYSNGIFVSTQNYKYPPTLYYLSYALFWVNLIYLMIFRYSVINFVKYKKVLIWLSSNSLWIYLWHILAYYLWKNFFGHYEIIGLFILKFIFLLSFGIIITKIQLDLVNRMLPTKNKILIKIIPYIK